MEKVKANLRRSLFKRKTDKDEFKNRYAITISICENQRIGRKLWKNVDINTQLTFLEETLSKLAICYDFEIITSRIEVGPSNGCRHLHGLIEFGTYVTNIKDRGEADISVEDLINKDWKIMKNYKTIKLEKLYSYEGWMSYMTKDEIIIDDKIIDEVKDKE